MEVCDLIYCIIRGFCVSLRAKLGVEPADVTTMREVTLQTRLTMCQENELNEQQRRLVEIAKQKTQDAYAPYSHFHVGAAALLADGQIVTGTNQENAAYPSGLCAERTTLFAANANHPKTPVVALAIASFTDGHFTQDASSPCGACRQVMLETEHRFGQPMEVILYGERECHIFHSASDLLPLNFVSDNLKG